MSDNPQDRSVFGITGVILALMLTFFLIGAIAALVYYLVFE
jgi:hypothetical protein